MTDLRVQGASAQVAESQSLGGRLRVTESIFQIVTGAQSPFIRVEFSTVQVVSSSISSRVRVAAAFVQTVRQSDSGRRDQVAQTMMQPVYTIGFIDSPLQRAWWFDWDGHTFYCLDLGNDGTLIYDLTTEQWTKFDSTGYAGAFNFKNGIYWRSGRKIVGGDAANGTIWELVPDTYLDEEWRPVQYEVRGIVFATGNEAQSNYALRLVGSAGRTGDTIAPVLNMRFSDDEGQSWSQEYQIALTQGTQQRLEFRSLGSFAHPGRIYRLYDTGGIKFIGRCEADIGE